MSGNPLSPTFKISEAIPTFSILSNSEIEFECIIVTANVRIMKNVTGSVSGTFCLFGAIVDGQFECNIKIWVEVGILLSSN